MVIDKINASLLMVRDFDASVTFYRDVLEFTVGDSSPGFMTFDIGDKTLAILDLSMAADMISEAAVQPEKDFIPRSLFAVFLDDADAAYAELKAKGVHFIKPPSTQPWGQRTAYFTDPDGILLQLQDVSYCGGGGYFGNECLIG